MNWRFHLETVFIAICLMFIAKGLITFSEWVK